MTLEKVELVGKGTFRVYHSLSEDPAMAIYVSLVEISDTRVRVGTPLGGLAHSLNSIEVQSIVQLFFGRLITIGIESPDPTGDNQGRYWTAYDIMTLPQREVP
jgi:hypothetical protein